MADFQPLWTSMFSACSENKKIKKIALKWCNRHKNWCVCFLLIRMKPLINLIPDFWVLTNFIWINENEIHQVLCPFHDPKCHSFLFFYSLGGNFENISSHQFTSFSQKKNTLRVKMLNFSLLVRLDTFLQNIRKFGSIASQVSYGILLKVFWYITCYWIASC
jgi:hypothetical protein